eukprot:TRINITY_DN1961_c0_g1_i2.p1 TRINITY_DN1961_c0_g1~~TRINITY_DN1961_c0_g1_i2.p1  ORF type:complete len:607 (+),score=160.65 TRINITY_DN1961_c0_g1_i2:1222-3042(+)
MEDEDAPRCFKIQEPLLSQYSQIFGPHRTDGATFSDDYIVVETDKLVSTIKQFNPKVSVSGLNMLINSLNTDNEGYIDFQEFLGQIGGVESLFQPQDITHSPGGTDRGIREDLISPRYRRSTNPGPPTLVPPEGSTSPGPVVTPRSSRLSLSMTLSPPSVDQPSTSPGASPRVNEGRSNGLSLDLSKLRSSGTLDQQAKLDALQAELQYMDQANKKLQQDIARKDRDMEKMKKDAREAVILQETHKELGENVADMQRQLQRARGTADTLRAQLDSEKERADAKERQAAELAANLKLQEGLKDRLEKANQRAAELHDESEKQRAANDALKKENKDLASNYAMAAKLAENKAAERRNEGMNDTPQRNREIWDDTPTIPTISAPTPNQHPQVSKLILRSPSQEIKFDEDSIMRLPASPRSPTTPRAVSPPTPAGVVAYVNTPTTAATTTPAVPPPQTQTQTPTANGVPSTPQTPPTQHSRAPSLTSLQSPSMPRSSSRASLSDPGRVILEQQVTQLQQELGNTRAKLDDTLHRLHDLQQQHQQLQWLRKGENESGPIVTRQLRQPSMSDAPLMPFNESAEGDGSWGKERGIFSTKQKKKGRKSNGCFCF